jgi:hypothetical protein
MPESATGYVCPFEVLSPVRISQAATRQVDLHGKGFFVPCAALFVAAVNGHFSTCYRTVGGALRELNRLELPFQQESEEAEEDLREYAAKKGWFLHRKNGG